MEQGLCRFQFGLELSNETEVIHILVLSGLHAPFTKISKLKFSFNRILKVGLSKSCINVIIKFEIVRCRDLKVGVTFYNMADH